MNSADLYGPPLPPGFKQTWSDDSSSEAQEAPTCTKEEGKAVIGPQCPPPDFTRKQSSDDVTHSELNESDYDEDTKPIGPKLPRECKSSDSRESDCEEDTFGPMPSMQNTAIDYVDDVVASVEKRAKDMKRKLDGNDIPVQKIEREEWMTVPNTSSKNQLGAISRCLSGDTSKKQKTSNKECVPNFSNMTEKPCCNLCGKQYSKLSNVLRHKRTAHGNNISSPIIVSKSSLKNIALKEGAEKHYKCEVCMKLFSQNSNLMRHKQLIHNIISSNKRNLRCALCNASYQSRVNFEEHIEKIHGLEIRKENLHFSSMEDFSTWKMGVEKDTITKFIKCSQKKSSKNITVIYICHRNGIFKSKGMGKRHLKVGGTNKINCFCPASIHVKSDNSKTLFPATITYVSSHLGHSCEVGRIPLAKDEKEKIAGQVLVGVPLQNILCKISEDASPTKRLATTNMQDLHNITKSYGLSNHVVRCENDLLSVQSWVREMMENSPNPILMQKWPGEKSLELPNLEIGDFALGFMNDAQEELFKIYGPDIISIDSTHGTNKYDIQLTTIIVRDDNCEGFPVAFLWSNRQSQHLFQAFFNAIKNRIGMLSSRTFISVDYPAFYNAWTLVFGSTEFYLLCDWHVKRAWSKNISRGSNIIKGVHKRQTILKKLYDMQNEVDERRFKTLLANIMEEFAADSETSKFSEYFKTNYLNRLKQWAACYRIDARVNTNMSVEKWHRELKYNSDLKGKCGGRLGKAIYSLIKSLRFKLLNRLTSINKSKLTKKLLALREAHHLALENLDNFDVYDNIVNDSTSQSWIVPSFSKLGETYKVKKSNFSSHTCKIFCTECQACLHAYKCNCPNSAIKYNMCKHIHFVLMKGKHKNSKDSEIELSENEIELSENEIELLENEIELSENEIELSENEIELSENELSIDCEKSAIVKELQKSNLKNKSKEEAKDAVMRFLGKLEDFYSDEQFKEVIKTISELTYKCEAMGKSTNCILAVTNSAPANKKIIPQRQFPAKKKKKNASK